MSESSLENGNMSIREANRRDGDGRNSDGCREEKDWGGGTYANRRKSGRKMEWRGIKLTLDEGERKKRKIEWVYSR